ncbi:hypothetical protein EON80_25535 [bacterium]|nr:MAG: hypothetical protein EON80_25535 [bacterium]
MLGKYTYLFIIGAPGLIFNLFFWSRWKKLLRPRLKAIVATIGITTAYWAVLDNIAVHPLGIWGFKPEHVTGVQLLGLPIEEWVLFVMSGGFIVPLVIIFVAKYRGVATD